MGGKLTEGGPGPVVLNGQTLRSSTPATPALSTFDREEFYDDYGCPCGDIGCDECDDPVDREELDFARGICRECEEWGEFQCRVHGDAYIEGLRFHDMITWLVVLARRGKRTNAGRRARFRLHAMRSS